MSLFGRVGIGLLLTISVVSAADLDSLKETYDAETRKLAIAHEAALGKLLAAYGSALDVTIEALRKEGDPDPVLLGGDEKDRFERDRTVPNPPASDLPSPLQDLQAKYLEAVKAAEIEKGERFVDLTTRYASALDRLMKQYTAEDRLDLALNAKSEKQRIESGLANVNAQISRVAVTLPSRAGVEPGAISRNLLLNPANEMPLVKGCIPHWTSAPKPWGVKNVSPDPRVAESAGYFSPPNERSARLTQDVSLEQFSQRIDGGTVRAVFSGQLTGAAFRVGDGDYGQLIVRALNADGKVVAQAQSQTVSAYRKWIEVVLPLKLPAGTKSLRCELFAVRRNGTATNGYFDDLSLVLFVEP